MPHFKLLICSNAVSGRDDEFNDWYDNIHVRDLCAVDGVVGGQRFRFRNGEKWKYLALYDLDCEDPNALLQEMQRRTGTEAMVISETFDMEGMFFDIAEPLGDYRTS